VPQRKTSTHRPLPEATAQALAERLRRTRADLGLTQEQLATRSLVSVQMIRRLEAGRANPTLGTLHSITSTLGLDIRDVL